MLFNKMKILLLVLLVGIMLSCQKKVDQEKGQTFETNQTIDEEETANLK